MASQITLETPSGPMPAVLSQRGAARGGIVVIQEAFGLTSHIHDICDRLAEAGYTAIAPALFHRQGSPVFSYDDYQATTSVMQTLKADEISSDVSIALEYLKSQRLSEKQCGIVGFCMGGTVAFTVAVEKALGAAATFYGGGISKGRFGFSPLLDIADKLQTSWIGFYGDQDQSIPIQDVEKLRTKVETAHVPTEIVRYPDAGHGFNCNDRASYHELSAKDAWERMLNWFTKYIGVD